MVKSFFNVRTAQETIDRMVLSVMLPGHPDSYMRSCYGVVCNSLRSGEFEPTDEIVLLGMEQGEGVIHGIIVGQKGILVDACGDDNQLEGDLYRVTSTQGTTPMEMHVKERMNLQSFHNKCLDFAVQYSASRQNAPQRLEKA